MILAIDPGPVKSAFVLVDDNNYKPVQFDLIENSKVFYPIEGAYDHFVIECIASYGMSVGKDVFETCYWIGRFMQYAHMQNKKINRIYRMEEKMTICHNSRARDTNIRHALIDRFAQHDFKNGKGKKDNPDWFFGFRADIWAAYAVGVTYIDKYLRKGV